MIALDMKILVDENIPVMTVAALRGLGHDVVDIRGTQHEGVEDADLWEMVQRQGRLFITTDKGFALHRGEHHHGILIIRLKQPNLDKIHQRVLKAMAPFSEDEWKGLLVVMRDTVRSVWRASE